MALYPTWVYLSHNKKSAMKNPIPLLKFSATILSIHIFSADEIHIFKLKSEMESFLQSWSHYYAQTALEVPAPACTVWVAQRFQ